MPACDDLTFKHLRGQVVRASWTHTALVDGVETLVDPSGGVVVKVKIDDDAADTYTYPADAEIVKDAVGTYHMDISTVADGVTRYVRVEGLGDYEGAAEGSFEVDPGAFA